MRKVMLAGATMCLVAAMAAGLGADSRTKSKVQLKFEGPMGKLVGAFAGKAAKEGIVNTVSVQGNRRMTVTEDKGDLVDLDAEKVYTIDFKNKTYKVQTFEEIRKEWAADQAKAEKRTADSKGKEGGREFDVSFDIKKTGEQKTINGFSCHEVIMTISMFEKGKTIEDGGMVIATDMWLGPRQQAWQEQIAFQQRYLKKLYGVDTASPEGLTQAMAMYPEMKAGLARMEKEIGKIDGSPILTVMTFDTVMTEEQAKSRNSDEAKSGGGMGGIAGGLGGMFGKKKKAEEQPKTEQPLPPAPGVPKTHARLFTTTSELLSAEASVTAADMDIPAGFKQK
jgi:hypothetical protein